MDNTDNIFKNLPTYRPNTKLDDDTAKRVPVIQVNLAYDVFTSPNDDSEPTLFYNNVTIKGYIDDKGNIEFPENEVIWEQIDKALILGHRLKKLNLPKSSYRVLRSDGCMGVSHEFGQTISISGYENAYYLVNINEFVMRRVAGLHVNPYDGSREGEIFITYECIHNGTDGRCEYSFAVRSSSLNEKAIIRALASNVLNNGLAYNACKGAGFRTVVDDGEESGIISYSGMHKIDLCQENEPEYYSGEDVGLVDIAHKAINEFFRLYNKEREWYQMI